MKLLFIFLIGLFSTQIYSIANNYCEWKLEKETKKVLPNYFLSRAIESQISGSKNETPLQNKKSLILESIDFFNLYIDCMGKLNQPINADTYYRRSLNYMQLVHEPKFIELAEKDLETAIKIDPNLKDAYIARARSYIKRNQLKEASDFLETHIPKFSSDSEILIMLGTINDELQNYPKSLLYFHSLLYNLRVKEGNSRYEIHILRYLGDLYTRTGNHKKAVKYYSQYLKLRTDDLKASLLIASHLSSQGKWKESNKYLQKILTVYPEQPNAIEVYLENTFAINPSTIDAELERLGKDVRLTNPILYPVLYKYFILKDKSTIKELEELISNNKGYFLARLALAEMYRREKKFASLAEELKYSVELAKMDKRYKHAVALLKELLELKKNHSSLDISETTVYTYIASCYIEVNSAAKALQFIQKAIDKSTEEKEIDNLLFQKAYILRLQGESGYEESQKIADSLMKKNNTVDLVFLQALNYLGLKKYPKAKELFSRAIDENNKNPMYYFYRALANDKMNSTQDCIQDLKKAIELEPKYAPPLNYLGFFYVEKNMEMDKAKELIQKAIEIDPSSSAYRDSLGWLFYKKGELKEALFHTSLALQLMDEEGEIDPTVYEHLGDIYFEMNDPINARDYWKKSSQLQKNPEDKSKILSKLKKVEKTINRN